MLSFGGKGGLDGQLVSTMTSGLQSVSLPGYACWLLSCVCVLRNDAFHEESGWYGWVGVGVKSMTRQARTRYALGTGDGVTLWGGMPIRSVGVLTLVWPNPTATCTLLASLGCFDLDAFVARPVESAVLNENPGEREDQGGDVCCEMRDEIL